MPRVAVFGAGVTLVVLAASSAADAQCVTFSPALACSKLVLSKPFVPAAAVEPPVQPFVVSAAPTVVSSQSMPMDCGIARQPDPNYRSAMPKIVPDQSTKRSVIKTIPTPACKQ
jgi:hypothetical protein